MTSSELTGSCVVIKNGRLMTLPLITDHWQRSLPRRNDQIAAAFTTSQNRSRCSKTSYSYGVDKTAHPTMRSAAFRVFAVLAGLAISAATPLQPPAVAIRVPDEVSTFASAISVRDSEQSLQKRATTAYFIMCENMNFGGRCLVNISPWGLCCMYCFSAHMWRMLLKKWS